jgi:hypothetical protein
MSRQSPKLDFANVLMTQDHLKCNRFAIFDSSYTLGVFRHTLAFATDMLS